MKEQLYKYLSIGLLALLLLVCFGSLITYFVVGQESINIAYALDTYGYYEDNLLLNSSCTRWDYNYTITNVDYSNRVVFFTGNGFAYSLYGSGSLVNNVLTGNPSISLRVEVVDATQIPSGSYSSYAIGATSSMPSGTTRSHSIGNKQAQSVNSSGVIYASSQNLDGTVVNGNMFYLTTSSSVSLSYLYFARVRYFYGFVPDTYSPNGYDIGYTDGVNSASGGAITGVNDLTGLSWEVPSETSTTSVAHQYDISGTVGDFNFDGLVMLDYPGSMPIGDNDSTSFKPFYLIDSNLLTQNITPYFIKPGDIITFTGGEDVSNTDLIQWLEDNNAFKTYTEGYQDGYNSGYDIGYNNGYAQGNTDTIVTLDTYLQPFGSSTFTGVINQDPTTFWWSVQPGMQPNTAVFGYLYFNISSLPIGSIVHFNFPFQKYILKDNSNVEHEFTDVRVYYDVDYYTNLLIAPRDSLPSVRFQQDVGTYSFNVIRPGDTIILYFPLNLVTDFNRYTFALTWSGDEYNYSFTTSSISQDIKTQLDNAYERGLKDGNSQGYSNGYTVGYNEGADGAEHYTFNNLLGAVFDAPITMFLGKYNPQTRMREGGLFNFELLGVNLTGFVIALLSIGVVLFIMRLFIRGL